VVATHARRASGCFVDGGDIVCAEGARKRLPLARVPITRKGQIGFQVENVMASVGAAWAVGVPWDAIRKAWPASSATSRACPAASTCSTTAAPP
jgi:cyanophycin synthetase